LCGANGKIGCALAAGGNASRANACRGVNPFRGPTDVLGRELVVIEHRIWESVANCCDKRFHEYTFNVPLDQSPPSVVRLCRTQSCLS